MRRHLFMSVVCALAISGGCASKKATKAPAGSGDGASLGAGLHAFELETPDGATRLYDVFVPKRASAPKAPLLVVMHGGGGSAQNGRESTKMAETAEAFGFVAVFPQGTSGPRASARRPFATWNASPDCCGVASKRGVDDVSFIEAVVEDVSRRVAIDPSRVYATGHSNGGMMALRLACEASGVFAAVAAVGSPAHDWSGCEVERPASVLVIHGEKDQCARFEGGSCGGCFERAFSAILGREFEPKTWPCAPVRASLEPWRARAGASGEPEVRHYMGEATCETWAGEGADVALCVDPALGHMWPDSAPNKACTRRPDGKMCQAWMSVVGPRSEAFDNALQWRFFEPRTLR